MPNLETLLYSAWKVWRIFQMVRKSVHKYLNFFVLILISLLFTACQESQLIITGVDEREANVILVFLDSKGIVASKEKAAQTGIGGTGESAGSPKFDIYVENKRSMEAMSILNSNGLPHRQGTDLLKLFAKQGLMSTEKEERIRYQAGLAQQLTNMILMIDGVIDANVQLSFPDTTSSAVEETAPQKVTAAVFVKHQGIAEDPNAHLENKIKRLVAGSVTGLDISDVTVVSDRSRFTDVKIDASQEVLGARGGEYVKIWSIVMSRESAGMFRFLFFCLLIIAILSILLMGWITWKVYPIIKQHGGLSHFFQLVPFLETAKKKWKKTEEPLEKEEL